MNFLNKLERRFGKYAIRNLPAVIIALYTAGYLISLFMPDVLSYCTLEPAYILRGQIWRIVTWILIPPSGLSIFTIIMLYFYFSLGKILERTWGVFRFNVYIFSGLVFTVIGSFVLYVIYRMSSGAAVVGFGPYFSTYYINMSIFLAFALSYPNMEVMLYFLIPIRIKWMGLLYGALLLVDFAQGNWAVKTAIFASLLNFLIFFLSTRNMQRYSPKDIRRRQEFKRNVAKARPKSVSVHRCAICGRTEKDGDLLEFRFCSKCDGNYEYCQDHLFTHQHIRKTQ